MCVLEAYVGFRKECTWGSVEVREQYLWPQWAPCPHCKKWCLQQEQLCHGLQGALHKGCMRLKIQCKRGNFARTRLESRKSLVLFSSFGFKATETSIKQATRGQSFSCMQFNSEVHSFSRSFYLIPIHFLFFSYSHVYEYLFEIQSLAQGDLTM